MTLDDLKEKRASLKSKSEITLNNMQKLYDESVRVADLAYHSREVLDDLDKEFEQQTGLQGNDVKFLFTAVGLQLLCIVIMNEFTKIEKAGSGNSKEKKLYGIQEKLLGKFSKGDSVREKPYYASMEHIITRKTVPYDATTSLNEKTFQRLKDKGREWDFDLENMMPKEKLSLFKGANHRFSTLGHDPILGLFFGTGNIMTNTITCIKTPAVMGVPVLTTNHVVHTSDYKDPMIADYGSTIVMVKSMIDRTMEQPSALVASLIKQIIHIGTDLYTPCGIQIPGANLLLTNTEVEKLTRYVSTGDLIKVGASAKLAELINLLISTIHTLMYDSSVSISKEVYNVKTRKIITYSNMIATGSNVLWTGGNMLAGNVSAVKQLDWGGLLVLLKRLANDQMYIRQIKEEFVTGTFKKMIQGEDLNIQEIVW